jgi:heme-degrading monooxygenase HmoA
MFARVTLFEIDTLRIPLAEAERLFDDTVVSRLHEQHGYAGFLVMRTDEGKGMVITLWDSEEAASAGVDTGFYQEQVARFVTFMRQPPGREHYKVTRAELPNASAITTAR